MPAGSINHNSEQSSLAISLVFAYYENPGMLALQWSEIASYPKDVKDRMEIIVVDDGSPRNPAVAVSRPPGLPHHRIFRIQEDIPWNQDAARNIGAHEALGQWLLVTDLDHVVPAETLQGLLARSWDAGLIYSFARIKFDTGAARDPHPNSYFMTKEMYWEIGGHDEDFAGIYGKDVLFRRRALAHTREVFISDLPLARVGQSLVPDSGTRTISRRNTLGMRVKGVVLEWLKVARLWRGVQTLSKPYVREV